MLLTSTSWRFWHVVEVCCGFVETVVLAGYCKTKTSPHSFRHQAPRQDLCSKIILKLLGHACPKSPPYCRDLRLARWPSCETFLPHLCSEFPQQMRPVCHICALSYTQHARPFCQNFARGCSQRIFGNAEHLGVEILHLKQSRSVLAAGEAS